MQLDQTTIAIRERGVLETMDMSLPLTLRYLGPLFGLLALCAAPAALFNQWLLSWMIPAVETDQPFTSEDLINSMRYIWTMFVLVFLQTQWAAMFATTYLSQAVFQERPNIRNVLRSSVAGLPGLFWTQGILRGVIPAWVLVWFIDRNEAYSIQELWLIFLLIAVVLTRSTRPFISEIMLLERNPLSATRSQLSAGQRSTMLHGPSTGELAFRWLVAAITNWNLFLCLFGVSVFLSGVFLFDWVIGPFMLQVNYPVVLWLLVLFATVVRFLSYLDLRIRQEGWEVELRLRAEANRLTRAIS